MVRACAQLHGRRTCALGCNHHFRLASVRLHDHHARDADVHHARNLYALHVQRPDVRSPFHVYAHARRGCCSSFNISKVGPERPSN